MPDLDRKRLPDTLIAHGPTVRDEYPRLWTAYAGLRAEVEQLAEFKRRVSLKLAAMGFWDDERAKRMDWPEAEAILTGCQAANRELRAERDALKAELRQAEFNHESNWCPERERLTAELARVRALPCPNQDCEERKAAADSLARQVFDHSHGSSCDFEGDDEGDSCDQCKGTVQGECSCDCGMCEEWCLALIIRPQGISDPQPVQEEVANA